MSRPALAGQLGPLVGEPGVASLLASIEARGDAARIVGGAVRNVLIGQPLTDIDIATTALPSAVLAIAHDYRWKAIPTGLEHGTVTLIVEGRSFEVTTLREDIETDGRHAVVRFGTDFQQDAARRDFTINAMSVGADGALHDYFGGYDDLLARRVRFIGSPVQRLREDYLRGLRFLRFSASYAGGGLDSAGLAAVLAEQAGLDGLSRERVRQEMLKLLVAPRAESVLAEAESCGLVSRIIGAEINPTRFDHFCAREREFGCVPDPIVRLYALSGSDAARLKLLRVRLRLSNREVSRLSDIGEALRLADAGASQQYLAYRFSEGAQAAWLLGTSHFDRSQFAHPPVFLVSGEDGLKRGVKPGPDLGRLLARTEAAWIAAGFPASQVDQLALLDKSLEQKG
ncbi:PcnB tRNA nucleotidyltransferase/poly(A) polymerase [Rhabdaerophilaceae bacterium]